MEKKGYRAIRKKPNYSEYEEVEDMTQQEFRKKKEKRATTEEIYKKYTYIKEKVRNAFIEKQNNEEKN